MLIGGKSSAFCKLSGGGRLASSIAAAQNKNAGMESAELAFGSNGPIDATPCLCNFSPMSRYAQLAVKTETLPGPCSAVVPWFLPAIGTRNNHELGKPPPRRQRPESVIQVRRAKGRGRNPLPPRVLAGLHCFFSMRLCTWRNGATCIRTSKPRSGQPHHFDHHDATTVQSASPHISGTRQHRHCERGSVRSPQVDMLFAEEDEGHLKSWIVRRLANTYVSLHHPCLLRHFAGTH